MKLLFSAILLIFGAIGATAQAPLNIPIVDFCALSKDPAVYDKKVVRTKAYYFSGYHGASLYDPKCTTADSILDVGGELSGYFQTDEKVEGELDKILEKDKTKVKPYVIVVGRFHDWNGTGYGHLNWSRFSFAVMGFERIKAVKAPKVKERDSQFMSDVQHLQDINWSWNMTFMQGHSPVWDIKDVMAENFEYSDSLGRRSGREPFPYPACADVNRSMTVKISGTFFVGNRARVSGESVSYSCPLKVECQYRFVNTFEKIDGKWKLVKTNITFESFWFESNCRYIDGKK
jgi:hypothetical protein